MSKKGVFVYGERNGHQITREQLVTAMLEGQTWQQVSTGFPVPLKRAMAYRLLHDVLRRARWGFAVKSSGFHPMTNAKHAPRRQSDDGQSVNLPGKWLKERESEVL